MVVIPGMADWGRRTDDEQRLMAEGSATPPAEERPVVRDESGPAAGDALSDRLERLSSEPAPDLALPSVVQLRFVLLAGEALLLAYLRDVEFPSVAFFGAIAAITMQVLSNGCLLLPIGLRRHYPQHLLGASFALDILAFTAVLSATGGVMNPFSLAYLVLITLSAVLLHQPWTWALGAMATVCYAGLFWLPVGTAQATGHESHGMIGRHLSGMWLAFVFAAATITFFIARVSATLGQRQREILRLQREVANQERLTSVAALAAGAAHEINTPLATIAIAAREIERSSQGEEADVRSDALLIRAEVERCRRIVERMSLRGGEIVGESPVPTSLSEIVRASIASLNADQRDRIRVNCHESSGMPVLPQKATATALSAILHNAIHASQPSEPVQLEAQFSGVIVEFRVRNASSAIDPCILGRITEPFFTTKAAGEGMGLGAYLARLFALRMGGDLHYESVPGEGVSATLTLRSEEVTRW